MQEKQEYFSEVRSTRGVEPALLVEVVVASL
jgi:hypothetical protein